MAQEESRRLKKHRSVKSVVKWVGWPHMIELVKKSEATQGFQAAALMAAMFTGGFRVSETVMSEHGGLKPENIVAIEGKKVLRFMKVEVMKKYKKVPGSGYVCHETGPHEGHAVWDAEHKHFKTERRVGEEIMRRCSVPLYEPLVPWVLRVKQETPAGSYLFPFDRFKAYRLVEELDDSIWPHWFRSQRASQLGSRLEEGGYEWDKAKMKVWFKWSSEDTATIYAHTKEEDELEKDFPSSLVLT